MHRANPIIRIEGAGIAGQVLRRELWLRGIESEILEKASFPRDKVCGGVLHPDSWEYLSSNFRLEAAAVPLRRVSHYWRTKRLGSFLLKDPLVYISRLRLDHELWLDRTPSADFPRPESIGLGSVGLGSVGLGPNGRDGGRLLSVKAAGVAAPKGEWLGFQGAAGAVEGLQMRYGRGMYMGLCEDGTGASHAAFLVRRKLYRNPDHLRAIVASELGIRLEGPLKGTSRIEYGYTGQDLAVGDAKLTTHPFLGLGMKHAIGSARLLAELIARGEEARYDELHRRMFGRMNRASRLSGALYGTPLRNVLWPFLAIEPAFQWARAWLHESGKEKNSGNTAGYRPVSAVD